MTVYTARLVIANNWETPREIIIEPWADEYLLAPKERMTLVSIDKEDQLWFYIDDNEHRLKIGVEGSSSYFIILNGRRIIHMGDCGESRGIEEDIEELRQSGQLGLWLKDEEIAEALP